MEAAVPEKQNIAKSQFRITNMVIIASTTLVVGLEVARHWGSYGWFNKFIGLILTLNLLLSLRELASKKEKRVPESLIANAYTCVLLATVLFGH